MSFTSSISAFIANTKYEDLTPETIAVTKTSIMDTIGIMFPATTLSESAEVVHDLFTELGGGDMCTLVGYNEKSSVFSAAFINGALCHAADFDDCASLDKPTIHPTACVMPAALATAEYVASEAGGGVAVSGKDFITAVAVANEVGVRLGFAPRGDMLKEYGFFGQTVIGNFMSTAVAAKLLGLNAEETTNALGLVVNRVSGPFKSLFTCDFRGFRDAFIAQDGLTCALFAKRGLKGCAQALEVLFEVIYRNDIDEEGIEDGLGEKWQLVERIGYKPWPSCGSSYPFVQGTLDILSQHNLKNADIAHVTLISCDNGLETFQPKDEKSCPATSAGAKSALPYIIATALCKQAIVLGDFAPETLALLQAAKNGEQNELSEIFAATSKIDYQLDNSFSNVEGDVIIETVSGETFKAEVRVLRGGVANPISKEEIIAKFKGNAALAKAPLSTEKIDALCDMLLSLEDVDNFAKVTAQLS